MTVRELIERLQGLELDKEVKVAIYCGRSEMVATDIAEAVLDENGLYYVGSGRTKEEMLVCYPLYFDGENV